MKKKMGLWLMMLCMTVFTVACGSSTTSTTSGGKTEQVQELTFKDQLGEVKVQKNPKKVVVFDFGALDTLDQLGVEVTGVPQANLPGYLSKYKDSKYQNVGSLKEPDMEKIAEIDPDLILISGRQQTFYEDLSEIAPTMYVGVDATKYMDSFKENMNKIGQVFGKEKEVEAELAQIDKTVADVQAQAAANGKNSLIILANEGAVSAFGPGSRFGLIHDVLGVPAVDKNLEVSTHGQSISFEYVAEKNPDYLFVIDRDSAVGGKNQATAKNLVENALVKNTNAYKEGHIVYLDQSYWYLSGGGLESVSAMINEVAKSYK